MSRPFSRFLFALLLLLFIGIPVSTANSTPTALYTSQLTLAESIIEIDLPLDVPEFVQPAPGDVIQMATSARWSPFLEISLSAELIRPASLLAGASSKFAATAGELKNSLQNLRTEQKASARPPYKLKLFDKEVESVSNQVELELRTTEKEPVIIHEWVTQENGKNWTFRVSYTPDQNFDESLLDQIEIRMIGPAPTMVPMDAAPTLENFAISDLPAPSWWQGDCDTNYYYSKAGRPAYPLGASFRGVKACGPRPVADSAPDVRVTFFPGAHGALEWECVELSMRFLWLAYQVKPYSGNGKDVVNNYSGTRLVKIKNDTVNKAPQPGDVLSYGTTSVWGHTSVVSASNVDSNGNGTITIIEENNTVTGTQTLKVANWHVYASMLITGWLHDPYAVVLTGPGNNTLFERFAPVTLTWNSIPNARDYTVQMSGPGINESATTTGTLIILDANSQGGMYQWRVLANTTDGKTKESMLGTFYRKYSKPTNLSAKLVNETKVALSWGPSVDAPGNIEGYRIYCGIKVITNLAPNVTSYSSLKSTCPLDDYAVTAFKGTLESTLSRANLMKNYLPAIRK